MLVKCSYEGHKGKLYARSGRVRFYGMTFKNMSTARLYLDHLPNPSTTPLKPWKHRGVVDDQNNLYLCRQYKRGCTYVPKELKDMLRLDIYAV